MMSLDDKLGIMGYEVLGLLYHYCHTTLYTAHLYRTLQPTVTSQVMLHISHAQKLVAPLFKGD